MGFLSRKENWFILILLLITLSVSPAFALSSEDDRNYLLIGCMGLGFVFFLFSHSYTPKIDNRLIMMICLMFIFQTLFHIEVVRFSSIFFTCMYVLYFMLANRLFHRGRPSLEKFRQVIKVLIYAYFLVLLIQQVCVLTGLPIFNGYHISVSERWKLNALSAEPSHTSRFVGILMYVFLSLTDDMVGRRLTIFESFKNYRNVWLPFLWIMLTTVSGTAILVLLLIFSRFFSKRIIWMCVIFLLLIVGVVAKSEIAALSRFAKFSAAAVTLSADAMIATDHSASVRIVPMLLCLSKIDLLTIEGWVGKGMGNVATWLADEMSGIPDGFSAGAMAAFALEYGIIIALFYIIISFKLCYDKRYGFASVGLWMICCILIGINSQIGWCCITFLYLSKQFRPLINANKSIQQLA